MTTLISIFVILTVLFGALGFWGKHIYDNSTWHCEGEKRMYGGFFMTILNILFIGVAILTCIRWQMGTDIKTGYIYAVDEAFGRGTVHLRMSLEAGKDSQNPFCVQDENLEKARNLAGTGKKVRVTIPATDFHFENNYFACTYEAIIEEEE